MKKTLPCRPFFTSAVTSDRASSTSARTSVDTCAVASRTSPPIDCSEAGTTGSLESGIEGSTGGTSVPLELVGLATTVLLHVLSARLDDREAILPRPRPRCPARRVGST